MRTTTRGGSRLARELAWRPEWPAVLASAAAWAVLIVMHGSLMRASMPAMDLAAPATNPPMPAMDAAMDPSMTVAMTGARTGAGQAVWDALGSPLAGWAVSSAAMMTLVTLPAVRHVIRNSLRGRRLRAMALYLAAYLAWWVVFGALALSVVAAARAEGVDRKTIVLVTLASGTAWQLSRWKRRALIACPRPVPLPPVGRRADGACVRFGFRQGGRCVVACAPLMAPMAVIGIDSLAVMVGVSVVVVAEQLSRNRVRLVRPIAALLAAATLWTAVLG